MYCLPLRLTGCLAALVMFSFAATGRAALWYVDPSAPGPVHDGTSWPRAWTSLGGITGLSPGDTVYISGGPSGSVQNYSFSSVWTPTGGSAGNPITYQIGQDSTHNGTAIFTNAGGSPYLNGSYYTLSGDAGDGQQHIKFSGFWQIFQGYTVTEVKLLYLNFDHCGADTTVLQFGSGSSKFEIGHCYAYCDADLNLDGFCAASVAGSTWDDSSFHDCTVYVPNDGNGLGTDCLQWTGTGFSIYNNNITGFITAYTGSQHQDGWQGLEGSYIKIYNNTFLNMANTGCFVDAYDGDFAHLWIYNNIISLSSGAIQVTNPPGGIEAGPDGGVFGNLGRWPSFTDVVIVNNLVSDYGSTHEAIDFRNNPFLSGAASVFTNCVCSNNIALNCNGIGLDAAIAASDNVNVSSAQAASDFVRYSVLNSSNNYHLASGASALIGQGVNLFSYFSIDHDSVARPASGAWAVGPYENLSGTPVPTTPRIEGSNGHRQSALRH